MKFTQDQINLNTPAINELAVDNAINSTPNTKIHIIEITPVVDIIRHGYTASYFPRELSVIVVTIITEWLVMSLIDGDDPNMIFDSIVENVMDTVTIMDYDLPSADSIFSSLSSFTDHLILREEELLIEIIKQLSHILHYIPESDYNIMPMRWDIYGNSVKLILMEDQEIHTDGWYTGV